MAFRPVRPNSQDYAKPFPDWIVDAIPGAAELRDQVADADRLAATAAQEATTARAALDAISTVSYHPGSNAPVYSPNGSVNRADWDAADTDYRTAAAAVEPRARRAATARRAYWEFVMDAQDEEAFISQAEPLYSRASAAAQRHLTALQKALEERDEFASSLGRVINVEGGNFGVGAALADISAYVAAGLADDDTGAWSFVTASFEGHVGLSSSRKAALDECWDVRALAIPASAKLERYRAIMAHHRIGKADR